jgi:hypothetical protein
MSFRRLGFSAAVAVMVVVLGQGTAKADTVEFVSWGQFSHPGTGMPGSGIGVHNSTGTSSVSVGDLSFNFTGVHSTLDITDAGNGVVGDGILGLLGVSFGQFSLPNQQSTPHELWGRLNGTQFTLFVTQLQPNPFPYEDTGSLRAQVKGTFVVTRDSTTQLNFLDVSFQSPSFFQIPDGRGYPPAIKYTLPEKIRVSLLDNNPGTSAPQGVSVVGGIESVPAPLPPVALAGAGLMALAGVARRVRRMRAAA